ncbi:serine hydrolase domain-containing protein [Alkalihalobacillus sp. LMS39]|uniref:serine hydrolase domain-containing protein n=1 Tax=Alkalihalobacillus sp. LMS39 TaxID=2924032 RepID=UPI001FB2C36A|nr:serine hydrolase domain-containing protein [Alkalihalobacillus sp. LMS39]UOE95792.1 beta-lactamase family protein [Alkalihalobacillus sp. LMS39]
MMELNSQFTSVINHIKQTSQSVDCSGAAAFVIHNDNIVVEEYWGTQSKEANARIVQANTQFHVASVRKSYIGFAVAYAIYYGYIGSIDEKISLYFPEIKEELLSDTTIRHLLTHTHGLVEKNGCIMREFAAGTSWAYRSVGVDLLTKLVKETTGKTIAAILQDTVFTPLGLQETGWYADEKENFVDVIRAQNDSLWKTSQSVNGDKMNMYVSARDLAKWGYFHLKQGNIGGTQIVPKELIQLATSVQSPDGIHRDLPQNGCLWFVKDKQAKKTEIGATVPKGSFQILGYTTVTLLVIPEKNLVAVRAFNSFGSPEGYNYLEDVRSFGDTVMECC